jgi:hypothetical protein
MTRLEVASPEEANALLLLGWSQESTPADAIRRRMRVDTAFAEVLADNWPSCQAVESVDERGLALLSLRSEFPPELIAPKCLLLHRRHHWPMGAAYAVLSLCYRAALLSQMMAQSLAHIERTSGRPVPGALAVNGPYPATIVLEPSFWIASRERLLPIPTLSERTRRRAATFGIKLVNDLSSSQFLEASDRFFEKKVVRDLNASFRRYIPREFACRVQPGDALSFGSSLTRHLHDFVDDFQSVASRSGAGGRGSRLLVSSHYLEQMREFSSGTTITGMDRANGLPHNVEAPRPRAGAEDKQDQKIPSPFLLGVHALDLLAGLILGKACADDESVAPVLAAMRAQNRFIWIHYEPLCANCPNKSEYRALFMALGLAQYQTTGAWPWGPTWRGWFSGDSPPDDHWLVSYLWHSCWLISRPDDDAHVTAIAQALAHGRADCPVLAAALEDFPIKISTRAATRSLPNGHDR